MTRLLALALALTLAACGGVKGMGSRPPRTLPASALPGFHSRARSLDGAALAADVGSQELAVALDDAGYISGSEREFFGRTVTFDHVIARVLVFEDVGGASRFLGWLRSHPNVVIGSSTGGRAPALGESSILFSLGPCGCHAETPAFLVAWRRGATVLWLQAAGPGATRATVDALARTFDQTAG